MLTNVHMEDTGTVAALMPCVATHMDRTNASVTQGTLETGSIARVNMTFPCFMTTNSTFVAKTVS